MSRGETLRQIARNYYEPFLSEPEYESDDGGRDISRTRKALGVVIAGSLFVGRLVTTSTGEGAAFFGTVTGLAIASFIVYLVITRL